MAKARTVYSCTECGGQSPKWQGQCPHCNAWNTLVETVAAPPATRFQTVAGKAIDRAPARQRSTRRRARAFRPASRNSTACWAAGSCRAASSCWAAIPGIGKSTLLLQAMAAIGAAKKALYVTGEESVEQVALRAQRLGLINAPVSMLAEVQLEAIVATIGAEAPEVVVIDSIQTAYTEALTSAPGSVAQVRECAAQLDAAREAAPHRRHLRRPRDEGGRDRRPARARAHRRHRPLFRGRHAFELPPGARDQESLRRRERARRVRDDRARACAASPIRRRCSCRSTARTSRGRRSSRRSRGRARCWSRSRRSSIRSRARCRSGCRSASIRSGCRCCSPCCTGTAASRPRGYDVFVNAVGGVRINEPAADLAILLAVHSSLTGRPLPAKTLVFGEVGLAGEIRPGAARPGADQGSRQAGLPPGLDTRTSTSLGKPLKT